MALQIPIRCTGTRVAPLLAVAWLIATTAAAELRPIEFNRDRLVEMAAVGIIAPPVVRESIYRVEADGRVSLQPGTGSITYNFRTGDSAVHMAGNHVEPAVSIYNPGVEADREGAENRALNALSAIGNRVTVLTGAARDIRGWVIGKHGGVEHVMVDFPAEAYDHLAIGDMLQVRTLGAGMELTNVAGVKVMNASPDLIDAFNAAGAGVTESGDLRIGVSHRIPARVMGSGLGSDQTYTGDYDIQMFDPETVEAYNLETLRFGDIVAIIDADTSYGRIYRHGAVTVGVVVHGRSGSAGHGPGVTTLFTSPEGRIELFIDPAANLAPLLGIRDDVEFDR